MATDLIHNLWCMHDEKYGANFPDEPHRSKKNCLFQHTYTRKDEQIYNEKIDILRPNSNAGNYASFPVYDQQTSTVSNPRQTDKINPYQTYQTQMSLTSQLVTSDPHRTVLIQDENNFLNEESTSMPLIRKRIDPSSINIQIPSSKV